MPSPSRVKNRIGGSCAAYTDRHNALDPQRADLGILFQLRFFLPYKVNCHMKHAPDDL